MKDDLDTDATDLDTLVATRLLALRQAQGLSLAQLAAASGVSKAMISKVERQESSPTAGVLGRLAGALGVSLSALLAPQAAAPGRLRRAAEQPRWRDPGQGHQRRQVSERDARTGIELVEIVLARAACVRYPPWSGQPYRQRLWLLEGRLRVEYGDEVYEMEPSDCLDFGVDRPLAFQALGRSGCRYLLVISAT